MTLCGNNDSRLPHVKELESIAHFGVNTPAIDATWFPNTPTSFFWSGSPNAGGATVAWVVSFNYGIALQVRLVRAGQ